MSALRRPGLLISVAVTVTVPGVLAALALVGHEHEVAQDARAEAISLGSNAPPASLPAAPSAAAESGGLVAAAPAAVREAAASMERVSGPRATVVGDAMSGQQATGIRLLGKAAVAGLAASYSGVELIAQWSVTGTVTMVSNVWHRGGLTITQTSDAGVLADSQPYVSYDADTRSPEGVFGVTKPLVGLLAKHYVAMYQGTGSAVGRPALVVELDRANGTLAARFWLDRQTMIPLRRDVYDTSARLVGEDAFVQVQFGALTAPPGKVIGKPAGKLARPAWAKVAPAQLLTKLDAEGWHLPAALPGGLSLYSAARSPAGEVADLGYSDGLSVVSLFVQRGTLAPKMAGWQPVNLNGHLVYVAEHSITWAGRGFVYTMIADAPPQTVQQVVASLPPSASPGFLGRISRGLGRLAALVNPFG